MSNYGDLGFATTCIHSGRGDYGLFGQMHDPISMTSNYRLPTDGSPIDWTTVDSNIYSRNGNDNQFILQNKLATIENAEECIVLGSGMAALSGMFLTFLNTGDHLICSKVCYSAVSTLFREILPDKFKLDISMVDTTNIEEVEHAVRPNTKLIHIETPGNPTTGISDIAAIAAIAKRVGAICSVDSTFASPFHQRPLELGADLVMHSVTKFLNGHGDALGGCVMGSSELIKQIKRKAMVNFGGVLSPFNAWLICRGISTFPLRMKQHSSNAMEVAKFIESQEGTKFIYYPGLESHPQHELASRQMNGGYSAMMCFALKGGEDVHIKFLNSLKLVTHAVSLGDTESLIVYTDAEGKSNQYCPEVFHDGYFRFSVGLEDACDIIRDMEGAYAAVKDMIPAGQAV